jgi:hypothetical protein
MRGTVAKRLRRIHLGDYSPRYRKYGLGKTGETVELGPRGRYRQAKKAYKKESRDGKKKEKR